MVYKSFVYLCFDDKYNCVVIFVNANKINNYM